MEEPSPVAVRGESRAATLRGKVHRGLPSFRNVTSRHAQGPQRPPHLITANGLLCRAVGLEALGGDQGSPSACCSLFPAATMSGKKGTEREGELLFRLPGSYRSVFFVSSGPHPWRSFLTGHFQLGCRRGCRFFCFIAFASRGDEGKRKERKKSAPHDSCGGAGNN